MSMGHEMKMSMAFGPISDMQQASGTAWQPEATPMHAVHSMLGHSAREVIDVVRIAGAKAREVRGVVHEC